MIAQVRKPSQRKPFHFKQQERDNYVRLNFSVRPKGGKETNLFWWRVYLAPWMNAFHLKEHWIHTRFNLIEGILQVKVSIKTDLPEAEVKAMTERLLSKDNTIFFN